MKLMENSMVERVARALARGAACVAGQSDINKRAYAAKAWTRYVVRARAAIEAMETPTRAMLDAAQAAGARADTMRTGFGIADAHAAMIRAALEPEKQPA